MGGMPGLIESSVPSLVFVSSDALLGLDAGIACAFAVAVALTVVRAVRRQPLRPALSSFVGVAVSSSIAHRTGSARDYFLPDIWISVSCCLALTVSIVVRRPLAGVVWSALNQSPNVWRRDRPSRMAYDVATAVLAGCFAIRFVMQYWLYQHNDPGAMAIVRIAVNYPLWAISLIAIVWAIRRSNRRLAHGHCPA